MTRQLSEDDLARLSACLKDHVGLHFPRERWRDMERGMRSAARDFEFHDLRSCVEWLLSSPLSRRQVEVLASHLTVGETYFFREKAVFEVFEGQILPELIRSKLESGERLRIWSAGCASGEEPYSIAIALDRRIGGEAARKATILATDINPRSLAKAGEGVYVDWSFRDAPPRLKETFFRRKGRLYEIDPAIKQQVLFSFLNLAEDAYPSLSTNTNAMDVIFCRNVLMYFSPEQAAKVVHKFHRCLVDSGWLIVSPCEASTTLFPEFTALHFPGVILYQKNTAASDQTIVGAHAPGQLPVGPHEHIDRAPFLAGEESFSLPSLGPVAPQAVETTASQAPPPAVEAAQALYVEGCYSGAIEILERDSDASNRDPKAIALAARAYANQGKLGEALIECERSIEKDKVNAGYHFLRAIILSEQGALEEARQALKRVLYLDPDFVLAHVALANLARQRGEIEGSIRHLEIARRLLSARAHEEIVPESEGMTSGRLLEIVEAQQGLWPNDGRPSVAQNWGAAPLLGRSRGPTEQ